MAEAEDAKIEPEVEDEEMNVTINGKPLMREETDENGEKKEEEDYTGIFHRRRL